MRVDEFDYQLPPELIAQEPVEPRHSSRLLVLHRLDGRLEDRWFPDIVDYLRPGDCLVLNDTRVRRARLIGERPTGGRAEFLLLGPAGEPDTWEVLVRPGRRVRPGTTVRFGDGVLEAQVLKTTAAGGRIVRFDHAGDDLAAALNRLGRVPLPPYITRDLADDERYQTVYAVEEGSAAAPTAGLHFTPDLLGSIRERGVDVVTLTLHVGLGTFRPVRTERVEDHRMHEEYFRLEAGAAARVNSARSAGGRIIAVGTTVTRALESAAAEDGTVHPYEGRTAMFIYPGYRFRAVDVLLTNFHLPRSTLLMLVSAFAGVVATRQAYEEAVRRRYRFFSFGDAMLIL